MTHHVMGSGKTQFLPLYSLISGKNWLLPSKKRCQEGLNHDVMGSGKNWFLPSEKRCQVGLNHDVMGSGKNRFLPLYFLEMWQELVLAI